MKENENNQIISICFQHVLLALKFAIDFAIPDVPYEVQIARAKNTYESHLALINQVNRIDLTTNIDVVFLSLDNLEKSQS